MKKNIPYDPDDFPHWSQIPVRFRDLDPLNHVNNAIFNTYFEESRIGYFRSIPSLLEDLRNDRSFVLVHLDIDYISTVPYPSILTIGARIMSFGNTSIRLQQACFDEAAKDLKAVCDSVLVWFDIARQKPAKLPDVPTSYIVHRATDGLKREKFLIDIRCLLMDKSVMYKIFSDPVHGFISIPKGPILRLIDHPWFQRLRRIRQLGLGYLVFPGAEHSRFSHALGAMGVMQRVLQSLQEKDTTITYGEYEGTLMAILLHDIGHGPFSHTLETNIISDFNHEMMTLKLMEQLNQEMDGALDTAIQIFTDQYPKRFLHQLVSSQLDIDRLDYLKRDSNYTGVYEGSIGIDRLIKTMRVHKGNIVIEQKGIYAVENYIIARRLMYMQVYLHKTVLSADKLMHAIFRRVRHLIAEGQPLHQPSPSLQYFLENYPSARIELSDTMIKHYTMIDDDDVLLSIKYWQFEKDPILRDLCRRFLNRQLPRTTFLKQKPTRDYMEKMKMGTIAFLKDRNLPSGDDAVSYYLHFDQNYSEAYKYQQESIWILNEEGVAVEFSKAADTKNIIALTEPVVKHYVVHPKECYA